MFEQEFDMALLFSAYAKGELDAQGQQRLDEWLSMSAGNRALFDSLMHQEELKRKLISFNSGNSDLMWDRTLQGLATFNVKVEPNDQTHPVVPKIKVIQLWKKVSIAAAVIVTLSAGLYFYIKAPVNWAGGQHVVLTVNDEAPGGNKATLSMANGQTITLDEAQRGLVITGTDLTYSDGSSVAPFLEFEEGKQEAMLLTAATPRGGTYQVTLSDGTHVWLNADSKLIFPAKFDRSERRVQLIGEAYFEVAKVVGTEISAKSKTTGSKNIPFVVVSKNQEVEVLGTHFNINSYADEGIVKTTLLEGSVKVSLLSATKGAKSMILSPGQQAIVQGSSQINVTEADMELAMAWKNGLFYFKDADLKTILRTFSRWYDMDVVSTDVSTDRKFSGKLYRNVNAYQALQVLKLLGLEFSVEKREQRMPQNNIIKP
uniref:FecR family protein n=1 Tax=Pedobacter schmidteae TaxID=2201271 RepID=UPI000EABD46F|nr:FecR family protein [Pedobacter schmidteae]